MPNDWMPGVRQQPTAATSARTLQPEAVVCHVIQGHRTTMDAWAAERPVVHQASYHFVIDADEDGTITQYAPISMRSWHAGRVPDPSLVTWSRYRKNTNPNDSTVGIGAAGFSETSWSDAQHASCVTILRWLNEEWGMTIDDDTLATHSQLDPVSRAHDPGPNFMKDWLITHTTDLPLDADEPADPNKPPPLGPFDSQRWAEAWARGATPVRTEGGDHIYEIKIRS